jgi:hypothetical protein
MTRVYDLKDLPVAIISCSYLLTMDPNIPPQLWVFMDHRMRGLREVGPMSAGLYGY